jgi:hypothetical protein
MGHYALLQTVEGTLVVSQVMTGKDETNTDCQNDGFNNWEDFYADYFKATVKRTSYNTRGGQHKHGGTPFRKNYAGVGYTYDASRDAFIPPKPFASFSLNETTCLWESPVAHPNDGKVYSWDEDNTRWVEV